MLVEAAFALPIFFLVVLSLLDLGDWAFQNTQAAHAARDGARQGIITFQQADVPSSRDYNFVAAAVSQRLAGRTYYFGSSGTNTNSTPLCIHPSDTSTLSPSGCASAIPGCDRIQVQVSWKRTPFSPIGALFGTATVKGQANMTISAAPVANGSPPGTPDTTGCP